VKLAVSVDERGVSLVEVVCALGILTVVLTAATLCTGSLGTGLVRQRVAAENMARSQLEYIKETAFVEGTDFYTPTIVSSTGCTARISATTVYTGIQLITVTVFHRNKPTFTMQEYKVNR
jgi:prepilin-type N-terminal cleavage/methylation domain-containing protein